MAITIDPNDPRLSDKTSEGQNEAYLVLSDEERAKGFVRPVRRSYKHVGKSPQYPLRDLTDEEKERHAGYDYVKYEKYPESESPKVGRFWTQSDIDKIGAGCGMVTSMGQAIAETYARDPHFYGATFCTSCKKHLPLDEFIWIDDGTIVGS